MQAVTQQQIEQTNENITEDEWAFYVLSSPLYLELIKDQPEQLQLILQGSKQWN